MQVVQDAQLTKFVESLPEGLDTMVGDRGLKLSGGEKWVNRRLPQIYIGACINFVLFSGNVQPLLDAFSKIPRL